MNRRYREILLVVLLLAVPFFFLRASLSRPEELNAVDRALLRVAAPIQFLSAAAARGVSDVFSDYILLVDVKQDNDKLSREVQYLRNEAREVSSLRMENKRLRELLGLKAVIARETVSAVVTTKVTTEYFRVAQLALDHSSTAIRPKMPVITLGGAVGKILTVEGDSATVTLVSDSGFGVDVVSARTGARGFVRGTGDDASYAVDVELVERGDELEVGDLLVTSGHGCVFPKGIAVATVSQVVKKDFGSYQKVIAEPAVDFSRLEEVLIVVGDAPACAPKKRRR